MPAALEVQDRAQVWFIPKFIDDKKGGLGGPPCLVSLLRN
jgi:hypothetical protein